MTPKHKGARAVAALLSPRNVAIVGASDRKGSWSITVNNSLRRNGFKGAIYPVNPRNETVWGNERCYKDLSSLPEKPDHVVVLVPGRAVIDTIREAGKAGARSATIFSSGFGEGGDAEGRALGDELAGAIAEAGLAVSGPNCLGNLSAPSSFMTLTDRRITQLKRGPIAIFGQSGGIVTAIYRSLTSRGMQPGYAVTVGNEIGLNAADYIEYFTQDADTQVIACFIEAIREPERFKAACLGAQAAGKPVVAIKIGGSEASRGAALAHTGSLAGSLQCFDAIAETIGVIRVDTIDEMTEVIEALSHGRPPEGGRVAAVTFSGGLKGLLLEAAERNKVEFPPLHESSLVRLREVLGIGTSLGNPLDAGFAALSSKEAYFKCIEILQQDPGIDQILVQEELPIAPGLNEKANNLLVVNEMAGAEGAKPIAVVSMASYMYSDHTREFRAGFERLPVLHEVDKALKAIRRASEWRRRNVAALGAPANAPAQPPRAAADILARARADGSAGRALGEAESKALLAAYGIASPPEVVVGSAEEAAQAAGKIGFPVVLKLVSRDVQHKTEVGGVILDVRDEQAASAGFAAIKDALSRKAPHAAFDGVLVARQISGGVELAVGVQRDPEVGPVVMFGAGGVLLELTKDVAFGPAPISPDHAHELISRTRAASLLAGFRGAPACDSGKVAQAVVALARLAADFADQIESIDVNPLVAVPGSGEVYALDALVVTRGEI
ncbi:MAG: acetate--CoA ligase family protein [Beijerinckiaceae bacterium]|jgi:acetyltransferase